MSSPSPFRAIQPAIATTQAYLFKPFRFERWMIMGLLSFLMMCGGDGGGGGGGFNGRGRAPGPFRHGNPGDDLDRVLRHASWWLHDHAGMIVTLVIALAIVFFLCALVFTWLSSRAGFVYLDNLRHDRHQLAAPWGEYGREANSYFLWKLLIALGQMAVFVLISLPLLLTTWRAITEQDQFDPESFFMGSGFLPMLLLWLAGLAGFLLVCGLVHLFLFDYVQPIQYLRRCTVGQAAREARSLIGRSWGAFLLFFLVKILLAVITALITTFATCLTCCLAAVPILGQAILQPLFVFNRAVSLHFLGQYGPEYRFFPEPLPPTSPAPPLPVPTPPV